MMLRFIPQSLLELDWSNLVAGAILSALLGLAVWIFTRIYESWAGSKDLPYPISGTWFSAEFDVKGEIPRTERNSITRVRIRRGFGSNYHVRVLEQRSKLSKRPATAWKLKGEIIQGDTLVGNWQSIVSQTKRFGTAVIKFIEYGRAVGYWIGPSGKDYPVYGYWILSRNEKDVEILAQKVLDQTDFELVDVAAFVMDQLPPEQIN